ncbi:MAG: hypothetical protein LBQ61_04320 [Spirochaetales bacterium]|jgi:hypothetical protein|nr:hypothetical protein [Spirochaetales bacterium]
MDGANKSQPAEINRSKAGNITKRAGKLGERRGCSLMRKSTIKFFLEKNVTLIVGHSGKKSNLGGPSRLFLYFRNTEAKKAGRVPKPVKESRDLTGTA